MRDRTRLICLIKEVTWLVSKKNLLILDTQKTEPRIMYSAKLLQPLANPRLVARENFYICVIDKPKFQVKSYRMLHSFLQVCDCIILEPNGPVIHKNPSFYLRKVQMHLRGPRSTEKGQP